jgi:hypothetical protein
MNNDKQSFESIKSKLRKLQSLAEQGYKGEAEAAKKLLDKLCEQYGVSLEDVLDQEKKNRYRFEIGKGKIWLSLFMQCYANVTGNRQLRYIRETSSIIRGVELTAYQFAEISNLFFWHKNNLKKDIEHTQQLVFEAYVQKHRIFRDRSNDPEDAEEEPSSQPIDLARLRAMVAMMDTLNDNHYHKMIETK